MEVARYGYDQQGDLVRFVDAEEYDWSYAYDGHLMVEHRTACGLSYCYRWAGAGPKARCFETWGEYIGRQDPALEHPLPVRPIGRDTRKVKGINYVHFTYSKKSRYTEAENGLGGLERFFGDAKGRIVKRVSTAGGVTATIFDPEHGGETATSSPDGTVRTVAYNPDGQPQQIDDGFGSRVEVFKDQHGLVYRFDPKTNALERRAYDPHGNMVYVEHADRSREQYELDERGLVKTLVDRIGARTFFYHDPMGNCVCVERGTAVEVNEYDYLGRRTAHVDASGRRTEWRYDRRSECIYKKHADGSEIFITRDALRKPVTANDAGRITRFEYGGLGWMTKAVGPSGTATEFRYDVEGNLTWVRNARGQVFRQWFDGASRCIACESFEGVRREAGYDLARRPKWIRDPLGREAREYDPEGRLSNVELSDGSSIEIKYGEDGLIEIGSGATKVERQFDLVDQLVRDKQGAHENRISWNGGVVTGVQSDTGVPLQYRRDLAGTLSAIQAGATVIQLNQPVGRDVVTRLGTNLIIRRTATPTGKLAFQCVATIGPNSPLETAATPADPRAIAWRRYEYDAAQNLVAEHHSDGTTIRYELTSENQIAVRTISRGGTVVSDERFSYDAVGTPVLGAVRFDAAARPIEVRGERLEYDELGRLARRLTDKGEWRYEWSGADELIRVVAPEHVVEMAYDATGRRLHKKVLRQREIVSSTSYVWSNHVPLHEINDLDGSTRTYVRDEKAWEPLGHVDVRAGVETATFYVNDPIGALDFAVSADGNIVYAADRSLYGEHVPRIHQVDVATRFPNQFYDPDVELIYNARRWYDPRLGLYVSPDPLLLAGTLNPRDYSPNPLRFFDPMGLWDGHPGPTDNPPAPANGHAPTPGVPTQADFGSTGNYTLQPGHWATEGNVNAQGQFVPGYATAPGKLQTQQGSWPANVRAQVDAAGAAYGCHGCGSKDPGTKSGHFIPDHQPQVNQTKAANREGQTVGSVRLYPHCKNCSTAQRDQAGNYARTNTDAQRAADAQAASNRNATHSPTTTS